MARIAGVDLPREKRLEIALTYIYGVGRTRAAETLAATGVSPDTRVKDATEEELVKLRDYIEANFKVEGDLRREVQADIRRKIEIGSYQGLRHRRGLPVHGQRTKTNARTRKGPKRTVCRQEEGQVRPREAHPLGVAFRDKKELNQKWQQQRPRARAVPASRVARFEERHQRPRLHQVDVQQHHRFPHGPHGRGCRLGVLRPGWLQGLA